MEFDIRNNDLEKTSTNCIVIGIFENNSLIPYIQYKINNISKNYITSILKKGDIKGKVGESIMLYNVPNINSERILLIGCGTINIKLDNYQYKTIIKNVIANIYKTNSVESILCFISELHILDKNMYWKIRYAIEIIEDFLYCFDSFKNKKKYFSLKKVIFNISNLYEINQAKIAIKHGLAISNSVKYVKNLGNLPPNYCTPKYVDNLAHALLDKYKGNKNIIIDSIDYQDMKKIGMNAYLAVGNASENKPIMSIIQYKGHKNINEPPIVFIGKGLTFDTGGLSIKPSYNMHEMKFDMAGAATVYGIIDLAINLCLPLNIIGVIASCENMVDSRSFRPGDVLTTLSGITVEVKDTDAEGRLVLCDVLTYVEKFNPEIVIDIATLTGACVIALGNDIHGLMSNNNNLLNELLIASKESDDTAWSLPIFKNFYKHLKSNIADISNIGGRAGSVITAGCFLSYFTKKYFWAHLDIAGTASYIDKKDNVYATGRPIYMLAQFLINRSKI